VQKPTYFDEWSEQEKKNNIQSVTKDVETVEKKNISCNQNCLLHVKYKEMLIPAPLFNVAPLWKMLFVGLELQHWLIVQGTKNTPSNKGAGYLSLGQFLTCPGEVKFIKPLTILMKKRDEITPCDIGV